MMESEKACSDPGIFIAGRGTTYEDDVFVQIGLVARLVEEGGRILEDAHGALTLDDELHKTDLHVRPYVHDHLVKRQHFGSEQW